jgi:hypothetical protein
MFKVKNLQWLDLQKDVFPSESFTYRIATLFDAAEFLYS